MKPNEYIKTIRTTLGYTTTELAKLSSYTQGHISGIENGSRNFSERVAVNLLKVMARDSTEESAMIESLKMLETSKFIYIPKVANEKQEILEGLYKAQKSIERCIAFLEDK